MCVTQDDVPLCVPDQWSPLNPEGKKRYERDFLMELQNDPQSKKKPENLPDIEVVLKDNTNRVSFK
jgi:translation initiation factor 4G